MSSGAIAAEASWPYYGGDQGGQRYSTAAQITPANVTHLKRAWFYSTGDLKSHADAMRHAAFEDTPILAGGRLYVCSPFNEVSALDPGTGKQLWRFDPKIDANVDYPNDDTCRGVAYWQDPKAKPEEVCAARIFLNTLDRRLIALDAATGKPCAQFGNHGTVVIPVEARPGAPEVAYTAVADNAQAHRLKIIARQATLPSWYTLEVQYAKNGSVIGHYRLGAIQTTSAPVVSHALVVVGSSIDDNQRVDEMRGVVNAFDAETGARKWSFDPIPQSPAASNAASWSGAGAARTGAANVWAPMSVDEQRGLVFLPTSSPSPDFFGGLRAGDNRYADSVVALHIETGQVAWSFQVTHHNVWDYDVPAQPTLASVTWHGHTLPAVVQTTKQGLLFTLDRDTGKPIIPVEERKVPQYGAVPGEQLSATQPFPIAPKPLAANQIKPSDAFGLTFIDRWMCRRKIAGALNEGLYTPPSLHGTIVYPFTGGGSNWGGLAFDPAHDIVYVNTSNAIHLVTLIPRKDFARVKAANPHKEVSPQTGAPYGMKRELLVSPLGMPCNPPPWGQLHAIDMHTGRVLWEVPLGTTRDLAPGSQYLLGDKTGTPNFGGPIVTASGLVFIGAAMDNYLRAFNAKTGAEIWKGRISAGGQATPMTYMWKGKQYVVIAAGGHSKSNTRRGDRVIAFALP
ncbi:MAG: pyrroloquinoline quinone-dependent dehydrogenase [Rhizomicrobium sp.]